MGIHGSMRTLFIGLFFNIINMKTINNTKNIESFKNAIANNLYNLLEEDWFKDLHFGAHDELFDFRTSIRGVVDEYLPDLKSDPLFSIENIKGILAHQIYNEIEQEVEYLIYNKDMVVKNGKWTFSRKTWTTRSVAKKISKENIFLNRDGKIVF
jgi:hypothetical protein